MSDCPGLHCDGCGDGGINAWVIAGGVVLVVAVEVAEWVAAHAIELALVTAVCFGIAIAAVAALFRLAGRRDARHAADRPFLVDRDAAATLAPSAERPALGFRDLHIHIDGQPTAEQIHVIRQAIGGDR